MVALPVKYSAGPVTVFNSSLRLISILITLWLWMLSVACALTTPSESADASAKGLRAIRRLCILLPEMRVVASLDISAWKTRSERRPGRALPQVPQDHSRAQCGYRSKTSGTSCRTRPACWSRTATDHRYESFQACLPSLARLVIGPRVSHFH